MKLALWFERNMINFVLWAMIICFLADTGMAALVGWQRGGFLFSFVGAALAIIATWVAFETVNAHRKGERGRAYGLAVLAVLFFVYTQQNGWAVMGITLSDGATTREHKANKRETKQEALGELRRERAAIGTISQSLEALQAQERLECSRKSKRYPDGVGPKCTDWREKIGQKKRAALLDKMIETGSLELDKLPKVSSGVSDVSTWVKLWNMWRGDAEPITADDARFWVVMGMVFLIGFAANFGFALVLPKIIYGGDDGSGDIFPPDTGPITRHRAATHSSDPQRNMFGMPQIDTGDGPRPGGEVPVGSAASFTPTSPGGGATHGGSSISINVGGVPVTAENGTETAPGSGSPEAGSAAAGSKSDPAGRQALPPPANDRTESAPAAPEVPVDRAPINELVDHLIVFRAACVSDHSGGVVTDEEMFKRYQSWAGERAIARAAFHTMFALATQIQRFDFGGESHYSGVALNDHVDLAAVG